MTETFTWSPDGTKLLYADATTTPSTWPGAAATGITHLRTIDPALREVPSAPLVTVDGGIYCTPAWQRVD